MNTNRTLIPIFFTIDDGYAPYLSVAVDSLIQNASPDYDYRIHVVHQGLSAENQALLGSLARGSAEIIFTEMTDTVKSITNREENLLRCDFFTLTIYFRLFLAQMFPQYDKGIYLDSDIVVPGDISQLYQTPLTSEQAIAACPDFSIQGIPELVHYLECGIGVKRLEYINSGVLVMNFKFLREHQFDQRFLSLMNRWHFDTVAPDQDYINAMLNGRIFYLDRCWDVMPEKGGAEHPAPKLIHYNLFDKPWCYSNIPYEDYFWRYAKKSAYYEKIAAFRASYCQAEQDAKTLAGLIEKAGRLPDGDITFRKLHEKGVQIRI